MKKEKNKIKNLPIAYEPKKKNRWLVTFPKEFNIPQWTLWKTSRPTYTFIDVNDYFIEPISLDFRDPITPSISQSLFKAIESISMGSENNKLKNLLIEGFTVMIELLDPVGFPIEKWELTGCKIKEIKFGDLNYDDDSIVTCHVIIQPHNVKLLY